MDELAGGAAYQRFSHTILWLENPKEDKEVTIKKQGVRFSTEVNRVLHLMKTRNGRGCGMAIGMNFERETLKLAEQGVILSKA